MWHNIIEKTNKIKENQFSTSTYLQHVYKREEENV